MTATARAASGRALAERDRREALDIVATVALATYSFIAALGFARVFADWQFVRDVAVIVIVGHGTSLLMRRLRAPSLAAIAVTSLALLWAVAWVAYPTTFGAIFPSRETWDIAWADLGLVRQQFHDTVAPVEYVGGWSLLAAIGTGFAVLTGDTFAFHARARGEALVPGAVLFVFVAALGADRHRVALTLALVAAGFVAAAVLRVRFAQPPRTSLGRSRRPLSVTLPAVALAGSAVVLGAWILGPRLPGAGADPLVDTHHDTGGVTEVLSPLVDIRSRLVNRADTRLFTVTSTAPAYWRVTGLPQFDGNTWGLPDRSLEDVDGTLSEPAPGSTENRQEITITGLRGPLVPSAAEPERASPSAGLRWNAETSTLVRVDRDLAPGDRFTIISATPSFTPVVLRAASSSQPPDPIYTDLPVDFPQSIAETATRVTAGKRTVYDQMLALQNWFRSEFRYSLDVPQGHSTSAIEAFLRQRVGYCEQFAGTFAAMARSLGIPARVAVGYTPGLAEADGSRLVLGRNAHAWPEVWFDGLGWVPFEPTPSRGEPGAQSYTGVAPAQDETAPGPGTDSAEGDGGALPPIPAVTITPQTNPITDPDINPVQRGLDPAAFTATVPDPGPNWITIAIVFGIIGLAVGLPAIVRRWRRAHPSTDVSRQMSTLWRRALGAVEATGCRLDPSLTPLEQARAISPRLPVAARPLKSLAEVATAATYGTEEEVRRLADAQVAGEPGPRRWCRQVERIAADSMTAGGRLRRYFTVWA
jgi:transglutaminase-like putative cysteine protease